MITNLRQKLSYYPRKITLSEIASNQFLAHDLPSRGTTVGPFSVRIISAAHHQTEREQEKGSSCTVQQLITCYIHML